VTSGLLPRAKGWRGVGLAELELQFFLSNAGRYKDPFAGRSGALSATRAELIVEC
jgi:hypothetical protein